MILSPADCKCLSLRKCHSPYLHPFNTKWQVMYLLSSTAVVWVASRLAWVLRGLGVSRWEQQFPENWSIEGTKDGSVEVDDSPKGGSQLGQLSTHQPEGSGRLWTPFTWAALQHGLEEDLYPFSYVWWREWWGGGRERKRERDRRKSALHSSSHPIFKTMNVARDNPNWMTLLCMFLLLTENGAFQTCHLFID